MTKRETEMALIQLGQAMKIIVEGYAANANHMSISVIGDHISVNACEYDSVAMTTIERDILNARLFDDGTLYVDGQYVKPGEGDVA